MEKKERIGVIGAMDIEIALLLEKMTHKQEVRVCDLIFYTGLLEGREVALVKCGVGKVNAARGTQMLIDRFSPAVIVNTGIAGAMDPTLDVGDAVIGTALVQHDFNATAFGYARGYLCTGADGSVPTLFYADEKASRALKAAAEADGVSRVAEGVIATGDLFVADAGHKDKIRVKFNASAAEMESCAIAQTAAGAGVPFAILRVMSDRADGGAPGSYETFEKETAERSARIICRFLQLYD